LIRIDNQSGFISLVLPGEGDVAPQHDMEIAERDFISPEQKISKFLHRARLRRKAGEGYDYP
jgi:hypothetical protein